jgi:predicted secreted protein
MSTAPVTSKLAIVTAGEPTLFDSLARLVPEELQTAYYRVLAHTRTLSPDDEMLRILEAMGILALLTRHTPKDIADERERFQELLELHRQFSDEAQQKMLAYVDELEARISDLPKGIKAGLDPQQIAKMLGESLRQHFVQSGVPETVKALQATSAAMTSAQRELSTALRGLSDSQGGVVATSGAREQPAGIFLGEPRQDI